MTDWKRRPRPPREITVPCEVSGEMTAADIAFELQQLKFDRSDFNAVRMDADARDYIVDSLSARQTTRR